MNNVEHFINIIDKKSIYNSDKQYTEAKEKQLEEEIQKLGND